jgi:hypothetical protein
MNDQEYVSRQHDQIGVHGLQARELQFPQEQEDAQEPTRDEQVLPRLQEACGAQRNQVVWQNKNGGQPPLCVNRLFVSRNRIVSSTIGLVNFSHRMIC